MVGTQSICKRICILDPRPQEKLPEQPKEESKIDFMHAANLLEGIGHELEGTQEDKKPLDPATSLDALASIQQAFDDVF
ncbi:hypothetical protein AAVH_43264 [Aphelenchoides avenae]|nr:hypothetical protein AAVH_43264 [Aphelenchus avenae]